MESPGWRRRRGSKPRSPKGRAAARGLDARLRLQHPFRASGRRFTQNLASQKTLLTLITVSTATLTFQAVFLSRYGLLGPPANRRLPARKRTSRLPTWRCEPSLA
jgi:hypothetical protein